MGGCRHGVWASDNLVWLTLKRQILPFIPVFDNSKRDDGTSSRSDFTWDEENDRYICPEGKELKHTRRIRREADARLMEEQAAFKRDYTARLAEAKEIILREENGVHLDQPLPPGVQTRSSAEALEHKADARVRRDHARREAAIKRDATDHYVDLAAEIRARDTPGLQRAFDYAQSQTRSGQTRS